MSQEELVGDLEHSVGYVLKQAAIALRSAMDAVLRPMELTVPQYSCLEVLYQQPGQSNAQLARATFVTRQAMNGVLRGLEDRHLVTRPGAAPQGRALPAQLTAEGRELLQTASAAVRTVEKRMLSNLSFPDQQQLLTSLATCVTSLDDTP